MKKYYDIDNGGISVQFNIEKNNDARIPSITFNTQYFGYTSISSTLTGLELTPTVLRDIGMGFIEFAKELELS